ncbi:MAG: phosphotransferase [Gemmatimonadaceae bacterium]|nr:phosphotransferase [Gemmatimonadaceae bacterium]
MGGESGCGVWSCDVELDGLPRQVILKVYQAGFADGSGLGPGGAARKSALALSELRRFGVPTPRLIGHASRGDMAAIVYQKVQARPWTATTRLEAAEALAKLHMIPISEIGDELACLVRSSVPNRDRTLNGLKDYRDLEESASEWWAEYPELRGEIEWLRAGGEPQSARGALVHGDYFSGNLLASDAGLKIVDWDLLALGDPMWDLGFLVGADREVGEEEAAGVVAAYSRMAPVDRAVVSWHRRCWRAFWKLRELRERGLAET